MIGCLPSGALIRNFLFSIVCSVAYPILLLLFRALFVSLSIAYLLVLCYIILFFLLS
jgi:hypothetical protein